MFDVTDYVPILSGKAAEYEALRELGNEVRSRTRPLIEITPIGLDHHTEQPTRTLEEHLERDVRYLSQCWAPPAQSSLFGDPSEVPPISVDLTSVEVTRTTTGVHPVIALHDRMAAAGVRFVPVTSLGRDADQKSAVAKIADAEGVCLRLDRNQWADPSHLSAEIFALLTQMQLEPERVDIIIDLGAIGEDDAPAAVLLARGALQALPAVHRWRSVTVAGSSFPPTIGEAVGKNDSVVVQRAERGLYRLLAAGIEQLPRLPSFGDYGVEGAAGVAGGVAPGFSNRYMTASIRYTALDNGWFLVRGGRLREDGFDQYHKLAATIVGNSAHWQAEDYSWGDRYIARCARHDAKPGTPRLWRQVAVNHHITVVTEELAILLET